MLKKISENVKGNIYTRVSVDTVTGKEVVKELPVRLEDGSRNPELYQLIKEDLALAAEEKKMAEREDNFDMDRAARGINDYAEEVKEEARQEAAEAEPVEIEEDEEKLEEDNKLVGKHKVKEETVEKDDKKLKHALAYIAGGVTISVIIMSCLKGCGKTEEIPTVEPTAIVTEVEDTNEGPSLEDLKNDSRYTEITEEDFTKTVNDLIEEFAKHDIEITGEDALAFVAVANITHLEHTNPELLNYVLGDEPVSEEVLTKCGHIIGQVVTLEVTDKDEQVDWTIALMDDTDRAIAQDNIKDVIEGSKEIAADKELTDKEKGEKIRENINENFIQPNFDKTNGYEFANGTSTKLSQEDGADFITDAIITGTLIGDNVLKNYTYGTEVGKDLEAISYNKDVVSNIMTMIETCASKVEVETTEPVTEEKVR